MTGSHAPIPPEPCEATIGRDLSVRVLNVSTSGCLIESHISVPPGVTGRLRLTLEGREFAEDVRVVRCVRIAGAGPLHHLGLEFLRPLGAGLQRPIRIAVRRLQVEGHV